jgi:hypothetical protein
MKLLLILLCLCFVAGAQNKIKLPMPVVIPPRDTTFEGILAIQVRPADSQYYKPGFTIFETVDGSDPRTSPTRFIPGNGFTVGTVLRKSCLIATYDPNDLYEDSDVITVKYTCISMAPEITPVDTFFAQSIFVRIAIGESSSPCRQVKYTINGDDPLTKGIVCSGPVLIDRTRTIKAVTVCEYCENSRIVQKTYKKITTTVKPHLPVAMPVSLGKNNSLEYNALGQNISPDQVKPKAGFRLINKTPKTTIK